jgi:DNA-binding CsgD family transcriptional regulator
MSHKAGVPELIAKLSDAQREYLRLVNVHLTSKEIALRLDVSRHTVNQRIDLACEKLGVSTRKEAARLFAAYDPIIYEPLDIADVATDASAFPDFEYRETNSARVADYTLRDTARPSATDSLADLQSMALPFPRKQGDANALSINSISHYSTLMLSKRRLALASGAATSSAAYKNRTLKTAAAEHERRPPRETDGTCRLLRGQGACARCWFSVRVGPRFKRRTLAKQSAANVRHQPHAILNFIARTAWHRCRFQHLQR